MHHGKLPYLFPLSQGGIFALGLSAACTITKLIANFSTYKNFFIISLLTLLFLLDAFLSFLKVKWLHKSRLFLFGILFMFALNALTFHRVAEKHEVWESEHSVQFAKQIGHLLMKSEMPLELQAIAKGLVLGSSKYLPQEIKNRTREGGILHLFAASGLHLGIFIGFSLLLLKRLFRYIRPIPYILALLLGFLYLYLLAFPVSFLRAYSFAVYSLLGIVFYRKTLPGDTLSYSSATVALFLPDDFLSVGFLLSFGAVFGIFFIKPVLDSIFFPNWKNMLKDNITLSLACSFSTFPTLVFYFHSFSFGSFWINLIVVPIASLLLPCLYLNLVLQYLVGGYLISFVWKLSDFFLRLFMRIVHQLTDSIAYFFTWNEMPFLLFLYFLLILLLLSKYYLFRFFQNSDDIALLTQLKSTPAKQRKNLFLIMFILGFHPFGIWYLSHMESLQSKFQTLVFKGNFFIRSETSFYILGKCYSEHHFKKAEKTLPSTQIQRIYIEDDSCLKDSIRLKKRIERSVGGIVDIMISNSRTILPIINYENDHIAIWIRYNGDKRTIHSLLKTLREMEAKHRSSMKESANFLILDFPTWSKEKPEEWKKFQKLLGISSYWKIMSVEELLARPLHDTDRDSKLSFR